MLLRISSFEVVVTRRRGDICSGGQTGDRDRGLWSVVQWGKSAYPCVTLQEQRPGARERNGQVRQLPLQLRFVYGKLYILPYR